MTRRAVVAVDDTGAITGLHYSPRLDHLPLRPEAELAAYQRARRRLADLLVDPAFELRFVLEAGQVLVFANDRVLHGRTGFDPQEGAATCRAATSTTTRPGAATVCSPGSAPGSEVMTMETVQFTRMADGTREEYALLHGLEAEYCRAPARAHPRRRCAASTTAWPATR